MIILNGFNINITTFPDKTSQVWQLKEKNMFENTNYIVWQFENEAELVHLTQLCYLLAAEKPQSRNALNTKLDKTNSLI